MHNDATSNPIGPFKFRETTETVIHRPQPDVGTKQDHSEDDFVRDLAKAAQQKPAAS